MRPPGATVCGLGLVVLAACGPPRVAKVGTSSDDSGSEVTGPDWSDESTSSASLDSGDEADAGDDGPRYDVQGTGKLDVPPIENACADPLPSTLIEGETELGPLTGLHAYFGDAWGEIKLVIYDESADLSHELGYAAWYGGDIDEGPALVGMIELDYAQLPAQGTVALEHVTADQTLLLMADVTIESAEYEDGYPYVPQVLIGTIAPWPEDAQDAFSGSFAATRCKVFEMPFPIE